MGTIAIGSFLLLLAVSYLIVRPLIAPRFETPEAEDSELLQEKEKLLADIRELDMDYATGKLTEEDYRKLRARSLAEAAATMQAIAESAAEVSAPDAPPREAAADLAALDGDGRPGAPNDDELEREIAARKEALREHTCPDCGAVHDARDRFCRLCGAQLAVAGTG